MKDPILEEIHRHRAAYAKRFAYDVHAIGEAIRRSEIESGGKFFGWDAKPKRIVRVQKSTSLPRKRSIAAK